MFLYLGAALRETGFGGTYRSDCFRLCGLHQELMSLLSEEMN